MSYLSTYLATIAKYLTAGKQKILREEMAAFAQGALEAFELPQSPQLVYVDATAVRVEALSDSPARVMLCGFPNVMQPGTWLSGGLGDGGYRENTSNVSMDFDVAVNFWGNEKVSQWYAVFAIAGDSDTAFTLKAMPYCRVKSQATQTISLGTNGTPATGIGYGWATDSLIDYILYFMSGASRGLMRVVTANNNDNGTGGTITYTGDALTVAEGDSFIILPATNFRLLGDIYNNVSSNINIVRTVGNCSSGIMEANFAGWLNPAWARETLITGCGGGAGGATGGANNGGGGGGSGKCAFKSKSLTSLALPGVFYDLTIGAAGAIGLAGGTTSFGSLLSLPGGGAPTGTVGGASGGDGGAAGGEGENGGAEIGGKGASGMFGAGGAPGPLQNNGKAAGKNGAGGGGGGGGGGYGPYPGAVGSIGFLEIETKI